MGVMLEQSDRSDEQSRRKRFIISACEHWKGRLIALFVAGHWNGRFIALVITGRRVPSTRLVGIRHIQTIHIVRVEFEVVDVGILLNPLGRDTLRQRHVSLFNS